MLPIDDKHEQEMESVPDIKLHDPVPNPRGSTTKDDIARAEGEGMFPAPAPHRLLRRRRTIRKGRAPIALGK